MPQWATKLFQYIADNHLGAIASILGLATTIIGFFITIKMVVTAKKAVAGYKQDMQRYDTSRALASVTENLNRLQQFHRDGKLELAAELYISVRTELIRINTIDHSLDNKQRTLVQGTIQHLTIFSKNSEVALADSEKPLNIVRCNNILNGRIADLQSVAAQLRDSVGRKKNGTRTRI